MTDTERESMEAKARECAEKILHDLKGRRGVGHELKAVEHEDEETWEEIVSTVQSIVFEAMIPEPEPKGIAPATMSAKFGFPRTVYGEYPAPKKAGCNCECHGPGDEQPGGCEDCSDAQHMTEPEDAGG